MIKRQLYLDKLIAKKENGMIKVITGIRRCGKSYLLFEIYQRYLNSIGIGNDHIIALALDDDVNIKYRNPLLLGQYVRSLITDSEKMYYVFLDEIQNVATISNPFLPGTEEKVGFVDVLLGLMKIKNVDLYVTGSNSKMLSSDILTEFRGRGDEIRVNPLSYKEFYDAYDSDKNQAWHEYVTYGGMPFILQQKTPDDKSWYLHSLFDKIYLDDILTRYKIRRDKQLLDDLLDIVSSSVGSLSNPIRIANTFKSKGLNVTNDTIGTYLDYLCDAFMLYKVKRYDVKGRKQIGSPFKYYFSDVGLRNARLNFRQQEENHIMENIIYNELCVRGYDVDVGVVGATKSENDGLRKREYYEVDFVANKASRRYYIQSAFSISDANKRMQETRPLNKIQDSFKKIVVVKDSINPWHDEKGILYIGIEQFLLEANSMDL